MIDRAAVALALASAAFVSVPASLIPQAAQAQGARRRVGRRTGEPRPREAFSSGVIGPTATTPLDFGGGYTMGSLLTVLDPALTGGGFNTGLVTSRFQPFAWGGGRGDLSVYGQLNDGWLKVDNGNPTEDNSYFATNAASPNILGARINYDLTADLAIGGYLAGTAAWHNSSLQNDFTDAGCDSRNLDRNLCLYDASVYLKSATYGKISVGVGETASDGIGSINLAGITYVTNNDPAVKVGEHEVWGTGWQFADVAPDVTGVTRGNRVRYDSPTIAGFAVSGSWGEPNYTGAPADADGRFWDAALRYAGEFGGIRVAGGVGFQNYDRQGHDLSQGNLTAGMSIQHIPTGLYYSGSVTGINRDAPFKPGPGETDTASAYYLQAGISRNFFGIGNTTAYGEYSRTSSGANAGAYFVDKSSTNNWGVGIVQNIDAAATSLYLTYNQVGAKLNGVKGDDIKVILAGARVKF
jgi:hypothetical protein